MYVRNVKRSLLRVENISGRAWREGWRIVQENRDLTGHGTARGEYVLPTASGLAWRPMPVWGNAMTQPTGKQDIQIIMNEK